MLRVNHPVPVTDLYVDLNILQRVSSDFSFSDWRREEELDWRSFDRLGLGRVKQERVSATEKIRDCPKLTILGKPGSGKTTLLKSLATACIEGKLGWDEPETVPVFVTLREFAEDAAQEEGFSLRDAISQQFDRWGFAEVTETILQQGRALILLDGLDEVPSNQSDSVIRQMRRFCRDYADNRFIITCRTQSLKFHFEGFTEAEIADFVPEQVERFIQNWFAVVIGNTKAAELAEQLLNQLQENKPIAELAVTPILLNLTCSVFRDERGKLPTKRVDFYRKGLRDLLEGWDVFRGIQRDSRYCQLTLKEKEDLLAQVAYTLFENNDYFPEQRKLERLIANHFKIQRSEAEWVLRWLETQHGLIIERSEGYFSFSHLTFQEYFAAKYIVNSLTPQTIFERLVTYIAEPRWREVFLLTVGMLESADNLLQLIKRHIDALLVGGEKFQQFLTWVNKKSQSVEVSCKPTAIRAFYFESDLAFTCDFHPFNLTLVQSLDSLLACVLNRPIESGILFDETFVLHFAWDLAFESHFDLALDLTLRRALNCSLEGRVLDRALHHALIYNCTCVFALNLDTNDCYHFGFDIALVLAFTNDLDLAREFGLDLRLNLDFNFAFDQVQAFARDRIRAHYRYNDRFHCLVLNSIRDVDLQCKLQELKAQLPDTSPKEQDNFKQWWQIYGRAWTRQLRAVMVEHRNIGHDWQFSKEQKARLKQYYDANKLLVDCLNSNCNISLQVRNKIEDTLLLPNTEIERRKWER